MTMGDSGKEIAPATKPDAAHAAPMPVGGDVELSSSGNPCNYGGKEKDVPSIAAGDDKKQQVPQKDAAAPADASVPTGKATTSAPRSSVSPVVPPRGPIVVGLPATTRAPPLPAAAPTPTIAKPSNPPAPVVVPSHTSNAPSPATQTSNPPSTAPPTVNKPVPPPSKKRKLPSTTPAAAAAPPASSHRPVVTPHTPLADPAVVKTVHDIIGLLQTYGPLTFGQLEYNLPPIATLRDILEVMVIMGVVQVVDDDNNNNNNNEYVRYCMLHGIPRADVVLPQTVVEDILEAQTEVTRSKERCRILKQVLSSNSTNPREVFKQILLEYPEIAQDPIYVAALRNVHVDMSAVDRERFKQQRQMTTTHQEQTQATTTTTSKEAMTRSESLELKMSSQQHDSTVVMTTSSELTKNESGESKTNDTTVASVVQDMMIKTEEKLVEDEKK